MASVWKKIAAPLYVRMWKMSTCTTVAAPYSSGPIKAEKEKVGSKRKVFQKLKSLTVETIDLILMEEEKNGISITQADLVSWAKRLDKNNGKPENALQIFRWMDTKKKVYSPSELAVYVDLIAKVKGTAAAEAHFRKVDPKFNHRDANAKNWPAYWKLADLYEADEPFKRHVYILPKRD